MKNKALTLIASSLLIMNAATANSANLDKDMDVSASIVSVCTLDAANATLNFGTMRVLLLLKLQ
jgi:hypothetical protein